MKSPLNTIFTALNLQKKQLEAQIYPLKDDILKKKHAITTLELYANEYKNQCYSKASHCVSSYLNQQHFLDKLFSVLYSEKQELTLLEAQQMELLTQYHALSQKLEGIEDLLHTRRQAQQIARDNIEDAKRAELATLRTLRQHMENNE